GAREPAAGARGALLPGLLLTALLGAGAALAGAPRHAAAQPAGAAWDALRLPGTVVVLRHGHAPGGVDAPDARPDDCATERNLDAAGRAQAARIGQAFRAR